MCRTHAVGETVEGQPSQQARPFCSASCSYLGGLVRRAGHVGSRRLGRALMRDSRPRGTDLRFTFAAALPACVFLVVFAVVLLFIVGISV
jgi:hypothetical protein